MESPILPPDLADEFIATWRDGQRVVCIHPRDIRKSRLDYAARGRWILRSQNSGVAVGVTWEEAVREARKIRDFCRYVDRKRAEEAGQ